MGCATSSDKSTSSYHPEEDFGNRLWISPSKSNYDVSPPSSTKGPVNGSKTNLPVATRTTEILSVCDDFQEGCDEEKSYGYFSESISTANTSDISFNANDCDLKMEMYMMTKISKVMPKTSSPILSAKFPSRHSQQPKDATYDVEDEQPEQQQQRSYNKWKQYLQRTPPYVLNNITRIPEAIAGQFTPKGFPGYTDTKRFRRGNTQRRPAKMAPSVPRY